MSVLIKFDKERYLTDKAAFESFVPAIQEVVDTFNAMPLQPLNAKEFERLFNAPGELVFDKMCEGKPVSIAGMEVNKIKAMEILNMPVGYNEFKQKIDQVIISLGDNHFHISNINPAGVGRFYQLNESGKVILHPDKDAELQRIHKKYATSERAKKILEFVNFIIDKSKEPGLEQIIKTNPDGVWNILKGTIGIDKDGKLYVKTDGVLRYNSDTHFVAF
ncbi:MAG: hypothetical protein ABIN97_20895 [Ginsengibacter sp.]